MHVYMYVDVRITSIFMSLRFCILVQTVKRKNYWHGHLRCSWLYRFLPLNAWHLVNKLRWASQTEQFCFQDTARNQLVGMVLLNKYQRCRSFKHPNLEMGTEEGTRDWDKLPAEDLWRINDLYTEKEGILWYTLASLVPIIFWYKSFFGGALNSDSIVKKTTRILALFIKCIIWHFDLDQKEM